jgi:hypothetical protein
VEYTYVVLGVEEASRPHLYRSNFCCRVSKLRMVVLILTGQCAVDSFIPRLARVYALGSVIN